MKKMLLSASFIGLLSGCAANPMPDGHYQQLSYFAGNLQKCFEEKKIDTRLYANAKSAIGYAVNTWSYDRARMDSMMQNSYNRASPTDQTCRQISANAHQLISEVGEHKSVVVENQRENQRSINRYIENSANNRPVYCNTVGTVTMCN